MANGWARKLPSGKWQGQYRDGHGNIRSARTWPRKRDAEEAAVAARKRCLLGLPDPEEQKPVTLRAFAEDVMRDRRDLRPSTRARDVSHLANHVYPAFGDLQLNKVTELGVRSWVGELAELKGLAPKTVRECHRILGGILEEALDRGFVTKNPCLRGRKARYLPRIQNVERRFLTPEQVDALAEAIDERYATMIYVGAYLGPRWGELAGLQRRHVPLLKRQLRVVGSLERADNAFRYVEETKTVNSRRTIPLPGFLVDNLAAHLATHGSEFVFPSPDGRNLHYQNWLRRFWNPAVEASGLAPLTPHALRHTAAAIMIDEGADPLLVQRRLGHKHVSTTLSLYGHLFPERDEQLSDRLDARFRAAHVLHDHEAEEAR